MSERSVTVFALDIHSSESSLPHAVEVCRRSAEDTMLFAPHDELGLVVAGTKESRNTLYHNSTDFGDALRFGHISVCYPIAAPTVEFLESLMNVTHQSHDERYGVNFVEILLVCAQLLGERTEKKSYRRTVCLLTDARVEVKYKSDFETILNHFQRLDVSLIVIGIEFSNITCHEYYNAEPAKDAKEIDEWLESLSPKAQNEHVLHVLCTSLGGGSGIVSVEAALRDISAPRGRKIVQRPLMRVVLSVGAIRMAVQLFTRTQEERLPSLRRVTAFGQEVVMQTVCTSLSEGPTPFSKQQDEQQLQSQQLIRGYRYRGGLIPCTNEDAATMKICGPRALDALAFVSVQQIPVYILMGSTRVIVPLPNDLVGAKAFRSFVQAMVQSERAMIVRLVRTRDANPVLGVCIASTEEERDVLFFSRLPFAEDVRHLRFPNDTELACGKDEEEEETKLVSSIVEEMTVEQSVLRPCDTFSPVMQHYYALLRTKLRESVGGSSEQYPQDEKETEEKRKENVLEAEVSPAYLRPSLTPNMCLMPQQQLKSVLEGVGGKLEACSRYYVFVSNEKYRMTAYKESSDFHSFTDTHKDSVVVSCLGDSTIAATPRCDSLSCVSTVPTAAASFFPCDAMHVTREDPVGTFTAMMNHRDIHLVRRTTDELIGVIFTLLTSSVKDENYIICIESVLALRQHCVAETKQKYFNSFLVELMILAKEKDHVAFVDLGLSSRALYPIAREECASDPLVKDKEAQRHAEEEGSVVHLEFDESKGEDDVLALII